ncbi:hypothetical protein [Streptomyces sp. NPDC002205]|uniref:hypothetical protein n=1 Tax=Streptomyces sp. NPDC002205 TaxID=3154411 RepID=UPI00332E0A8B
MDPMVRLPECAADSYALSRSSGRGGRGRAGADHCTAWELDAAEERLAKELEAVPAEREELVVAERVLVRLNAQAEAEADEASAPAAGQVAGRAVLLVPHREKGRDEKALPEEYRKVFDIVRSADEPVMAQFVCRLLGISAEPRFREAMRSRLNRLADRGRLRQTPAGRFAAVL